MIITDADAESGWSTGQFLQVHTGFIIQTNVQRWTLVLGICVRHQWVLNCVLHWSGSRTSSSSFSNTNILQLHFTPKQEENSKHRLHSSITNLRVIKIFCDILRGSSSLWTHVLVCSTIPLCAQCAVCYAIFHTRRFLLLQEILSATWTRLLFQIDFAPCKWLISNCKQH